MLGFIAQTFELKPLGPDESLSLENARWIKCRNYSRQGACNWMVLETASEDWCQACELNHVIPDLSQPENRALWLEVERAKRRLIYSLNRLGLPVTSKNRDPQNGLSFDIKADAAGERVLTGHSEGLITLNIEEADVARREKIRLAMKERYRTLLGHFRHEIGHYYWDRLVSSSLVLVPFRARFGDETSDYQEALNRHYDRADEPQFSDSFISFYASSHPWEDFAETFAHYLHMIDTLETAEAFGFVSENGISRPPNTLLSRSQSGTRFDLLMAEWVSLTVALNSLNRSMGLPDAYPFAVSVQVAEKLRFIHDLIRDLHHPESPQHDDQSQEAYESAKKHPSAPGGFAANR